MCVSYAIHGTFMILRHMLVHILTDLCSESLENTYISYLIFNEWIVIMFFMQMQDHDFFTCFSGDSLPIVMWMPFVKTVVERIFLEELVWSFGMFSQPFTIC